MLDYVPGTRTDYLHALNEYAVDGGDAALRRAAELQSRLSALGVDTSEMLSRILAAHEAAVRPGAQAPSRAAQPFEVFRQINETLEEDGKSFAKIVDDDAAQLLAVACLRLDMAARALPEQCGRCLGEVQSFLVNQIQVQLPPLAMPGAGLLPAIRESAARILQGTKLELTVEGSAGRLPKPLHSVVLRVAEEALTNVVRHARARSVTLRLKDTDWLQCSVRDDGVGFDPDAVFSGQAGAGVGLLGIRERVKLLGGALSVHSAPGKGSEVAVRLPAVAAAM